MSDDTTTTLDPPRADDTVVTGSRLGDDLDLGLFAHDEFSYQEFVTDEGRRRDNPLIKGLLALLMVAVATTVLVATDDEDDATIEAGETLASVPVLPDAEPSPPSSVQAVASEAAGSDPVEAPAADTGAEPWVDGQSAIEVGSAVEQLRHQLIEERSTTTVAPTTTAPPTTAAPATVAPTTTPSTTTPVEDTTADTTDTTGGEETTTTEVAAEDTTATTAAPETTTTAPPTTAAPETTANGDGWVDAGHGVLVPPVLLAIRWCESRDDYQAANSSSSARGAYQFIKGSWAAYGHADRYGVSEAHFASNAQQDEAALLTWQRDGTRPWNASRSCWSSRI